MTDASEWDWYQSRSEEGPYTGPDSCRDDAVMNGRSDWEGEGFWVAEAKNPPVKLSDWIGDDGLIERANDSIYDNERASQEWDDGDIFKVTPQQDMDLRARVKAACDEWQAAHGLTFNCNTFAAMRNVEWIEGECEQ